MHGDKATAIRSYVSAHYIAPARAAGKKEVKVRVGTVHEEMNLTESLPAVAGALCTRKFENEYRVKKLKQDGPTNAPNCEYTFECCPIRGPWRQVFDVLSA